MSTLLNLQAWLVSRFTDTGPLVFLITVLALWVLYLFCLIAGRNSDLGD